MNPGYGYFSFNPWVGIISIVLQVLFWVLIFKLIFSLIGHHHRHEHDETCRIDEGSNLEIIKTRYAKGEITKKEYEEMKKELS